MFSLQWVRILVTVSTGATSSQESLSAATDFSFHFVDEKDKSSVAAAKSNPKNLESRFGNTK